MAGKLLALFFWGIFFMGGCASSGELLTLKKLGSSQKEIANYLNRQDELFNKLISDLKDEKLEQGISKREIIDIYGEPILIKSLSRNSSETIFLYRHPTEYFDSDKVYIYFDEFEELSHWEYLPRQ
ncbi:MAG: hypothetical protein ABIH08_00610 [Candidatus Omnitrophota bacterium]